MPAKGQKHTEEATLKIRKANPSLKVRIVCAFCGGLSNLIHRCRAKTQRFCSQKCSYKGIVRKIVHHKFTIEEKKAASDRMKIIRKNKKDWTIHRGSKNYGWKGENVSYRNLHRWIENIRGKAFFCEDCGCEPPPGRGIKRSYFHWANISGLYFRILEDWKQLCYKCHKQFDVAHRKVNA